MRDILAQISSDHELHAYAFGVIVGLITGEACRLCFRR